MKLSRQLFKVTFESIEEAKHYLLFADFSKMKALAYDKINQTRKLKYLLKRVESILGYGKNVGY